MNRHASDDGPVRPDAAEPEEGAAAIDWNQMGVPAALVGADGALLQVNRSMRLLLSSARQPPSALGLDWLSCLSAESRVALFTALADRRPAVSPLAWQGGRPGQMRWFAATLRWRGDHSQCVMSWQDVTLLQQAERQASAQAEQVRVLANASPVMMASFDADSLRCLYGNRSFAAAFGLEDARLFGQTLSDIVGEDLAALIDPALDQLRRTLRPTEFETELHTPQMASRRVEVRVSPRFDAASRLDGLFLHLSDVTRQRDSERALQESEARLSRFMQGSVEGIVFHDQGLIADANPAFCDLIGHGLHELLGRSLTEFVAVAPVVAPALTLPPMPSSLRPNRRESADLSAAAGDVPGPEAAADPGVDAAERRSERLLRHADGSEVPVEWIDLGSELEFGGLQMTAVRDLRHHKAAQAHAHYLAHHDVLTGLANRRAFLAQLEHLMVTARSSDTQLGLLFLDLDDFKRVNDSIGHMAADAHLTTLAQRLSDNVRSTDRVARFGGDEFMVLLPGVRDSDDVAGVAHKLVTALSEPLEIEGRPISVTPSIGVALYPRDASSPEELIKHADTAMHVAKSRGRATVTVFEPSIATSAYDNVVLEGQLGHAIAQDEFTLLFQPQVRARDGEPVGVEALIRWQHPERGLLSPGEFIDLAEQHRLMLPIGRWVLDEAARTALRWREAGLPPLTMAVNLSALQFQAPDFLDSVEDLLRRTFLPPGWLELEITERMLMDDLPAVRERLHRLRSRGVRVSVDDFGTGYSSLAHLRDLPIDRMKIDRSFVRDLPADRASVAITRAIIQLAQGLGLTVVAEGVESAAQQRCLSDLHCDELQGLAISPPLSDAALEAWVRDWPGQARTQWTPTDVGAWSDLG